MLHLIWLFDTNTVCLTTSQTWHLSLPLLQGDFSMHVISMFGGGRHSTGMCMLKSDNWFPMVLDSSVLSSTGHIMLDAIWSVPWLPITPSLPPSPLQLGNLTQSEDALCEANILNNLDPVVWAYLTMVCVRSERGVATVEGGYMVWDRVYTTEIHAHMRWQSPSLNHTSVVALSPGPSPPKERRGLGTRLSSVADEVCYWSQLTLESANSISHCS